MLGKKLALDLGSAVSRLHVKGEPQVIVEPSLVALDAAQGRVIGVGSGALSFDGGEARQATMVAPVHDGAVGDLLGYEALLQHLVTRGVGRQRIFKPDLMLAVMSAMSGQDRRAVMEMAVRIGARTTYLIDAPLAAATGAGLPVTTSHGHLVVDVGAGKTDVAVVAAESVIVGRCLRRGGRHLDAAVARHVAAAHGVLSDAAAAEDVKIEIGSAVPLPEERRLVVRGRDQGCGEPAEATLSSTEIGAVVREQLQDLGATLREVLAETPATLAEDVRQVGAVLTGGAARLRGLDRFVSAALGGTPVRIAAEPENSVVRGVAMALDNLDVMRRNFLYIR
jgi:rod shape-determining protein MreB and related proteins